MLTGAYPVAHAGMDENRAIGSYRFLCDRKYALDPFANNPYNSRAPRFGHHSRGRAGGAGCPGFRPALTKPEMPYCDYCDMPGWICRLALISHSCSSIIPAPGSVVDGCGIRHILLPGCLATVRKSIDEILARAET